METVEIYEFEGKKYRKGKCLAGTRGEPGRLFIAPSFHYIGREEIKADWPQGYSCVFEAISIEEAHNSANSHSKSGGLTLAPAYPHLRFCGL